MWWVPAPNLTADSELIQDDAFRSAKDPRILSALARAKNRGEPLTSGEIAEEIDDSQDIIYNRLRKLEDRGWVSSLKAGATSKVWMINKAKLDEIEA